MTTTNKQLIIHFMDGSRVDYDLPQQSSDKVSLSSKLSKLIESQYIIVESDGSLQFFPVNNIKSIQVYPLPEILPDNAIKGATVIL